MSSVSEPHSVTMCSAQKALKKGRKDAKWQAFEDASKEYAEMLDTLNSHLDLCIV